MSKGQILSSVFLLMWGVGLVTAESQPSAVQATENDAPALACRFETQVKQSGEQAHNVRREWYLWRQENVVEIRDADDANGQIWRRDKNGQVSHQRIFHTAKRVIEYYPGDLRALQSYPEWKKLTRIIDPTWLSAVLSVQDKVFILNRQARRYTGQINGQELEVLWLEQEQIPAYVRRTSKDYEEIVNLKEIYLFAESPWPRNETAGYDLIDYADLGDKESDPFVRAFLHSRGPARDHSH